MLFFHRCLNASTCFALGTDQHPSIAGVTQRNQAHYAPSEYRFAHCAFRRLSILCWKLCYLSILVQSANATLDECDKIQTFNPSDWLSNFQNWRVDKLLSERARERKAKIREKMLHDASHFKFRSNEVGLSRLPFFARRREALLCLERVRSHHVHMHDT